VPARPIPRTPREHMSRPAIRWVVNGVGLVIIALLGLSLFVLPLRDYFNQRNAIAQKTQDFELLADATEALQNEVDRLKTPAGIRAAAREQLGYVAPGEERMTFVPTPALPTDLPDRWPYTIVTEILEVRATQTPSGSGALTPLSR
jgi:cell division protein FtsB